MELCAPALLYSGAFPVSNAEKASAGLGFNTPGQIFAARSSGKTAALLYGVPSTIGLSSLVGMRWNLLGAFK